MNRTTTLKLKDIKPNWYIIDCTDQVIGRLSTRVSKILQGKNKPNYSANLNNGDKVILINSSKIRWTGKKAKQKLYRKHSGFLGGLKERTLGWMMQKNPNVVLEEAIYKMLPKNRMRDVYMNNLYVYKDENHKHEAQKPVVLDIEKVK
jgi:large subunit ribosomal protein L13